MKKYFYEQRFWLWPLIIIALIAPFTPWIDLSVSRYFYRNGSFATDSFVIFIYDYGQLPALIVFAAACLFFLFSYLIKSWKPWRTYSLIMIIVMAIGAGLITNALLKDNWGRPRPKQTIEFGGTQPFRPFYQPNFTEQPEPSKAFPCGHCTMGFYFFAPAMIGIWAHRKRLIWISLTIALVFGGLLSYARIAQGGHFFSDVLFSAFIMWLTSYLCCYALLGERE